MYIIVLHVQDVETVVGEISGGIEQLENLSDVRLRRCCDELTRGVVEGLWRRHNPQHQLSFSQGKPDTIALFMYISEVCVIEGIGWL